jgi:energy-converting hydrogenase Eha subunit F
MNAFEEWGPIARWMKKPCRVSSIYSFYVALITLIVLLLDMWENRLLKHFTTLNFAKLGHCKPVMAQLSMYPN